VKHKIISLNAFTSFFVTLNFWSLGTINQQKDSKYGLFIQSNLKKLVVRLTRQI